MTDATMGKPARRKGLHPSPTNGGRGGPLSAGDAAAAGEARLAAARGDVGGAIARYVELVKQGSTSADVFNDLGALIAGRGHLPGAIIQFEMALALAPRHPDARANLLKALESVALQAFRDRRWLEAAAGYARLVNLVPDSATFHNNAGAAFRELKQPARALAHLEQARMLDPERAIVHYNLGSALFDLSDPRCEAALLRALELAPDHVDALVNLGLVYFRMGRFDAAEDHLQHALSLAPDHGEARGHLASVLRELGRLPESLRQFRAARAARPASIEIASNMLLARQADPEASAEDLLAESRAFAARFADPLATGELGSRAGPLAAADVAIPAIPAIPDLRDLLEPHDIHAVPGVGRKLRVGYVSADFRNHSVARFIEPILATHDRTAFEIVAYSDASGDDVTRRMRGLVDAWVDTRMLDDAQLAARVAADRIDILVDLGGHTGGHRLLCFARRPAAVQVTYCGYPGTTGLASMDWRLTDSIADPANDEDRHGTEKLWRLPNGFLCFQPDPTATSVALPRSHARGGAVTFGSFNNLAKIGEPVLALWARVLHAIPSARLLMKSRALGEPRPQRRIRACLEEQGVDPERVEFVAYAASTADHLALYARVDIGLDPFPYNGTTTTCEALWMGVPVVTLLGQRHAGRVGASLLSRVGLGDLVATTPEEYVGICARLSGERGSSSHLGSEIRRRLEQSPLMSPMMITRDIEEAYRHFWIQRNRAIGTSCTTAADDASRVLG